MPRYSKTKRPPVIIKQKGGKRGFYHDGEFIQLFSPLTDDELIEDIARGFDVVDDTKEKPSGSKPKKDDGIPKPEILSHDGLYDDQINAIAKSLKLPEYGYIGTYPIDKIHTIVDKLKANPKLHKQFGFIMNTDPSDKPGQHWIAVCYIKGLQELDYYNSLAEQPTEQFREEIKPVIDELSLPYYLKYKVNLISRQDKSTNCGYHALDFLYRLLVKKQKFKFATGYDDVREGENKIKKFKNDLGKFGYIA